MGNEVIFHPAYWGGKKLCHPHVPPEAGKFSQSVVVDNLIFVSGCQGQNDETLTISDDFVEQMNTALEKVRKAMETAGSCMDNVIKTAILLKDVADYPVMRRTELEFYQKCAPKLVEDPPASTLMEVGLDKPEYLVEIEVIGVMSRG